MEAFNLLADTSGGAKKYGKDPYSNLLAMYISFRTGGQTPGEAIANLRALADDLGLK